MYLLVSDKKTLYLCNARISSMRGLISELYSYVATGNKRVILLLFILDAFSILISGYTAYKIRFSSLNERENYRLGIFTYNQVIALVAITWIIYLTIVVLIVSLGQL